MAKPYQKVVDYFSALESRLGYDLFLGGVKHFGYYPSGKNNINEKKAQELMQDLIAKKLKLTNKDKVLDAGCGQGHVACYLAKKYGCQITGITVTPFEVEKAKRLVRNLRISNQVNFLKMDYTYTNFPDSYFNAIYTMESFVHAYDMKKALYEFKRILKPKGRVAFFEYSMPDDRRLMRFDKKFRLNLKKIYCWMIDLGAMPNLKNLRPGHLQRILKKFDFNHTKEEIITPHMLPSAARLYQLAKYPYKILKFLNLEKVFFNTTVAAEFFPIIIKYQKEDIFRYNITSAKKP